MSVIQRVDFLGIPARDAERARGFYRDVLGLRPDEHAEYELWAGDTCLAIWEPETDAIQFHRAALVRPRYGFEGPQWLPDSQRIGSGTTRRASSTSLT